MAPQHSAVWAWRGRENNSAPSLPTTALHLARAQAKLLGGPLCPSTPLHHKVTQRAVWIKAKAGQQESKSKNNVPATPPDPLPPPTSSSASASVCLRRASSSSACTARTRSPISAPSRAAVSSFSWAACRQGVRREREGRARGGGARRLGQARHGTHCSTCEERGPASSRSGPWIVDTGAENLSQHGRVQPTRPGLGCGLY